MIATRISLAAVALMMGAGSVAAQQLELPSLLVGAWETDLANCERRHGEGGWRYVFDQREDRGLIFFGDNATEVGMCEVVMVDGQGAKFQIAANCGWEENLGDAATIDISLIDGTMAMSLAFSWGGESPDNPMPQTLKRCPAVPAARL